MRRIFHIVPRSDWDGRSPGPYQAPSIQAEGFIHCSNIDQVARVANLFFKNAVSVVVLAINADLLGILVRDEAVETGEKFPHVYGPIRPEAIIEVHSLRRGEDNRWVFGDEGCE